MPKRGRTGYVRRPAAKRRRFNRKRTYRRRPTLGRPTRGLRPAVYLFKRRYVETFSMSNAPSNWDSGQSDAITTNTLFKLEDLSDYTDFTNLFAQYKITAAKMEMYFSQNVVEENPGVGSAPCNVMVYMAPNRTGATQSLTEQWFLNNQTTRKKLGIVSSGRPVTMYMPLKQLSERYASAVNTDYATMRPSWVSTSETTTAHFGNVLRMQYVNGENMRATVVKVIWTYYVACKQAQ